MQSNEKTNNIKKGLRDLKGNLDQDLKDSLYLIALGWGEESHNYHLSFKEWIVKHSIRKSYFLQRVGVMRYEVEKNNENDIEYDYRNDDQLKINWLHHDTETVDTIYFDGFRFESYVGSQRVSFDNPIDGEGHSFVFHASEYLQEHWIKEVEVFVMNNLKYAEVE